VRAVRDARVRDGQMAEWDKRSEVAWEIWESTGAVGGFGNSSFASTICLRRAARRRRRSCEGYSWMLNTDGVRGGGDG